MKELTVNRDLCIGCCRCVDISSAIFGVDGGLAFVKKQPDDNEKAVADNARENCPVEAINWKE